MNRFSADAVYVIGACLFAGAVTAIVSLDGCTQHDVKVSSPTVDRLVDKFQGQTCPTLDLPPVPSDVILDIKGDNVTANAGGEQRLRGYVLCRSSRR